MRGTTEHPSTEVLTASDCWTLLRTVSVGRVAFWHGGHPEIFPINYTVDQHSLVFRTGPGTKLSGVLGEGPVAFEADGVDPDKEKAWSVVVKGRAGEVERGGDLPESVALVLFPWEEGRKDHYVRISPDAVTGRRFTIAAPITWWTPVTQSGRASHE